LISGLKVLQTATLRETAGFSLLMSMQGRGLTARRGFTLIEIIVTLGLVALVAGLMVLNVDSIIQGLGPRPLPDLLHKAVREARYQAASTKQTVLLRYDPDTAEFQLTGENGADLGRIETHYEPSDRSVEVVFEQVLPARGLNSFNRTDNEIIQAVRFRPDRSSTPFLARLRYEGTSSTHQYDPFSDLELARE